MNQPTPQKSRSQRRRKPQPRAWHEHPWLVPGIALACGLMLVVVAVLWWQSRGGSADPVEQAQQDSGDLQDSIHQVYNGDYTLLDPNELQELERLPKGLKMRPGANELVSPWGRVDLMGANEHARTQGPYTHYLVIYYSVPQKDCAALAGQMLARYGQVWIGPSPPLPNPQEKVADAGQITARCQGAFQSIMALGQ